MAQSWCVTVIGGWPLLEASMPAQAKAFSTCKEADLLPSPAGKGSLGGKDGEVKETLG